MKFYETHANCRSNQCNDVPRLAGHNGPHGRADGIYGEKKRICHRAAGGGPRDCVAAWRLWDPVERCGAGQLSGGVRFCWRSLAPMNRRCTQRSLRFPNSGRQFPTNLHSAFTKAQPTSHQAMVADTGSVPAPGTMHLSHRAGIESDGCDKRQRLVLAGMRCSRAAAGSTPEVPAAPPIAQVAAATPLSARRATTGMPKTASDLPLLVLAGLVCCFTDSASAACPCRWHEQTGNVQQAR
jgi:hypothetical protein